MGSPVRPSQSLNAKLSAIGLCVSILVPRSAQRPLQASQGGHFQLYLRHPSRDEHRRRRPHCWRRPHSFSAVACPFGPKFCRSRAQQNLDTNQLHGSKTRRAERDRIPPPASYYPLHHPGDGRIRTENDGEPRRGPRSSMIRLHFVQNSRRCVLSEGFALLSDMRVRSR